MALEIILYNRWLAHLHSLLCPPSATRPKHRYSQRMSQQGTREKRDRLKSVTCVQPIFPAGKRYSGRSTGVKLHVSAAAMQFPSGEVSPLPISSISHLSRVVKDVEKSSAFYTNVLGFVPVRRPSSLSLRAAG